MKNRRTTRPKKRLRQIVLPDTPRELSREASASGSSTKQIQELIDLLRRNNLTELEIERDGFRIRVRHEVGAKTVTTSIQDTIQLLPQQPAHMAVPSSPLSESTAGFVTVTSPIVGTFYRSPSPDADPYVEEGDVVKKGQVLCIIEAMKLMNEIESEVDGRVVKVLVENMKSVEYGQALFLIDPKAAL